MTKEVESNNTKETTKTKQATGFKVKGKKVDSKKHVYVEDNETFVFRKQDKKRVFSFNEFKQDKGGIRITQFELLRISKDLEEVNTSIRSNRGSIILCVLITLLIGIISSGVTGFLIFYFYTPEKDFFIVYMVEIMLAVFIPFFLYLIYLCSRNSESKLILLDISKKLESKWNSDDILQAKNLKFILDPNFNFLIIKMKSDSDVKAENREEETDEEDRKYEIRFRNACVKAGTKSFKSIIEGNSTPRKTNAQSTSTVNKKNLKLPNEVSDSSKADEKKDQIVILKNERINTNNFLSEEDEASNRDNYTNYTTGQEPHVQLKDVTRQIGPKANFNLFQIYENAENDEECNERL